LVFFFSSRRRHTRFSRDWSSDVCSSDLALVREMGQAYPELVRGEAMITETVELEEQRFLKTLGRGLQILAEESQGLSEGGVLPRSEERRVGRECGCRWAA